MATSSLSSSTNMVEYSGMSMALKHWGGRTHKRSRVRAKSRPSGTQIGHTDRSRNLDCVAQAAVLPHCHAGRSNAMCEGRGGVAVTYRVGEGVGAVPALLRADAELREPVGRPPARQNRLTKRRRRRGPTHCGVRRTGCSRCRTCRQCRVSLQSSGQRWSASECRGTSRGAGGGGGVHRHPSRTICPRASWPVSSLQRGGTRNSLSHNRTLFSKESPGATRANIAKVTEERGRGRVEVERRAACVRGFGSGAGVYNA